MVEIKKIFLIIDYFHHLSNTSPTQVSSSTSIIAPVVCNIHPYIYIEVGLLKQWLHQPWVENFSSSTSLSSCSSTCCCSGSSANLFSVKNFLFVREFYHYYYTTNVSFTFIKLQFSTLYTLFPINSSFRKPLDYIYIWASLHVLLLIYTPVGHV